MRLAEKADPLSPEVHVRLAYALLSAAGTMRRRVNAPSCRQTIHLRAKVWAGQDGPGQNRRGHPSPGRIP
jgi:hypothetical protein